MIKGTDNAPRECGMQAILDDVNAVLGPLLAEQGLTAVYEHADNPDSEDDFIVFAAPDGSKSVVHLQVNSLDPSLDSAILNMSFIETVDLPFEGWKIVDDYGVENLADPHDKATVLRKAAVALRENVGSFDLSEGVRHGLLTHPQAQETYVLLSRFASDSGDTISLRPYVTGDSEGFELKAGDGRAARVEMKDGQYQVTALGERVSLPYLAPGSVPALEGMLRDRLGAVAPRP